MGKQSDHNTSPTDFAQTTPRDMYLTSDIRLVMIEVGKLTSASELHGTTQVEFARKLDAQNDKIVAALANVATDLKTHASEMKADFKEKSTELKADLKSHSTEIKTEILARLDELKKDHKEIREKAEKLENKMSFYKGAIAVLGLIFTVAVAAGTVFARYVLDKI